MSSAPSLCELVICFHFQLTIRGIKVHQVLWKLSSNESYTFCSPLQTKGEVLTIDHRSQLQRLHNHHHRPYVWLPPVILINFVYGRYSILYIFGYFQLWNPGIITFQHTKGHREVIYPTLCFSEMFKPYGKTLFPSKILVRV